MLLFVFGRRTSFGGILATRFLYEVGCKNTNEGDDP